MRRMPVSLYPEEVSEIQVLPGYPGQRKFSDGWALTEGALAGQTAVPGPCTALGQYTSEMSSVCSSWTLGKVRLSVFSLCTGHRFTLSSMGK